MNCRLPACASALSRLGALLLCASAGAAGPNGGCCLGDGTCIEGTTSATCSAQGGAFAGNGTSCATLVCHALPYAFALSPGDTSAAVPQFDGQDGLRNLTKVTLHLAAELNAVVTITNVSPVLPIIETTVLYQGALTAGFGTIGPLVVPVDETYDCGAGVILGPGQSCDFGGPIQLETGGMDMVPPPNDLSGFIGPGTIDAVLTGDPIFAYQGGVPFSLSVPVHFVEGTITVVYEYVVKMGACCFDDGSCLDLELAECVSAGGIWQGPDTACDDLGPDACDIPCDGALFTIELLTDDFGDETTIEVVDESTGVVLIDEGPFASNTFFEFNLCLEGDFCITFTIRDEAGNGICCDSGAGFYRVLLDGAIVCEGGAFEDSESCTIGDGCDDCNDNGIPDVVETRPEPSAPLADGAEDDCADAAHVGPGVYTGTTDGATISDAVVNCDGAQGLFDVWYRYRPAWSGPVIVSSYDSPMPLVITVHDFCPTGDAPSLACAAPPVTDAKLLAERKTDYWIRVTGVGAARGDFQITVVGPDSAPSLVDCNGNGIPDECECIGDLNGDGTVDIFDAVLVWVRIGETCTCPEDLDGNGVIEWEDFIIVLKNRGRCPFPGAVAPPTLPDGASHYGPTGQKNPTPVFVPVYGF